MRTPLILFGALAVAFGGAFLWARSAALAPREPRGPAVVVGDAEVEEHRVTEAMAAASIAMSDRPAPPFRAVDHEGRAVDSAALVGDRPVVLVFIQDGCPCSASAEPFYADLHAAYGDGATFLGVIDGPPEVAARWVSEHGTPYPVLADPSLAITRDYGATNSAYVALIDRGGRIATLWPGYSVDILREISGRLAEQTGRAPAAIDAGAAPVLPYSGCPFPIGSAAPAE